MLNPWLKQVLLFKILNLIMVISWLDMILLLVNHLLKDLLLMENLFSFTMMMIQMMITILL